MTSSVSSVCCGGDGEESGKLPGGGREVPLHVYRGKLTLHMYRGESTLHVYRGESTLHVYRGESRLHVYFLLKSSWCPIEQVCQGVKPHFGYYTIYELLLFQDNSIRN